MSLLYNLGLTLHLIFAAAWFGLSLPLAARFRYLAETDPPCRVTYAPGLNRSLSQLLIFLGLAFISGLVTFLAGGGFAAYGPRYHTSMLLMLLMIAIQFFLGRTGRAFILQALDRDQVDTAPVKRIAMLNGMNHLLWLVILILMLWHRFH